MRKGKENRKEKKTQEKKKNSQGKKKVGSKGGLEARYSEMKGGGGTELIRQGNE